MTTTSISTPEPAGADDHVQFSRRFLEHSRNELRNGELLQASEKAWGAVAHALKAIAVQRGWQHNSHYLLHAISDQLGREFDRTDFFDHLAIASSMHQNFYENNREEDAVAYAIDDIERFLAKLDEVRVSPPMPFTVSTTADQRRLRTLRGWGTAEVPAIGAHSDVGFTKADPADG